MKKFKVIATHGIYGTWEKTFDAGSVAYAYELVWNGYCPFRIDALSSLIIQEVTDAVS